MGNGDGDDNDREGDEEDMEVNNGNDRDDNDDGQGNNHNHDNHDHSTPNCCCKQLLAGWKWGAAVRYNRGGKGAQQMSILLEHSVKV